MEKNRILILYENNHCITPCKKNCFFLNMYIYIFFFYHNISVFISLTGRRRLLLFIGVLLAQEIPKELILLCMDYNVAFRLENIESQK